MTDTWRPMSALPPLGKSRAITIDVRTTQTYRWLPYKPDGRKQMKADGRWQEATEYGWKNCSAPAGEWKLNLPIETSPEPIAAKALRLAHVEGPLRSDAERKAEAVSQEGLPR